ncbi:molybdenum cofactor guanylyltransferase MobA [Rhizobium leucaenae]|uniref:Molybdenum cofactor guanylyltransferase n=1 Tax=Rhizobium leucaenae TaxID=29450 RepID=A0A7W6ZW26_9HYPH|nr:molybdenum cofactor guanylyltransferase MobA [Rhizobium leucaenae]MBB4569766.1 molybdopterin-guanine dinucleotide biosynthesis protein A [Rhizobium leucaenae]MBB6299721.1 molybdopterin-guanine dinucleotide biosynthesis protein A [Rhizobium leucaenae]
MPGFITDPAEIPPYLLAGGRSSRMGANKAFALLGGERLLTRIAARIRRQQKIPATLNADADWPDTTGLPLVPDTVPGKLGPLAGVLAAMRDAVIRHPYASHIATVPIDSPFFPGDLIARLAQAIEGRDEIAIAVSLGRDHPVFGLWPVSIADDLETWILRDDKRRVRDFLARHSVRTVSFAMIPTSIGLLDPFFNINTPDDLTAAETWLAALEQTS